jgi:hypothetical protein
MRRRCARQDALEAQLLAAHAVTNCTGSTGLAHSSQFRILTMAKSRSRTHLMNLMLGRRLRADISEFSWAVPNYQVKCNMRLLQPKMKS